MQSLQSLLSIGRKIRLSDRRNCSREEPRLPLLAGCFPLCRLVALLLLYLLLERCRERILLVDDGIRDAFPELPGFVGKLFFERGDILRDGVERVEVDEEQFFLFSMLADSVRRGTRDVRKPWRTAGCQVCSRPCPASSLLSDPGLLSPVHL